MLVLLADLACRPCLQTCWSCLHGGVQERAGDLSSLRVVDDAAERGVRLVTDYSQILTKDEQQLQLLLQLVEEHRNKFPDMKKFYCYWITGHWILPVSAN